MYKFFLNVANCCFTFCTSLKLVYNGKVKAIKYSIKNDTTYSKFDNTKHTAKRL